MKQFIATLFCVLSLQLMAQTPKSFPTEDDAFIQAFSAYVQKSKRAESVAAATEFITTYEGLSSEMKSAVQATANAMLKKKVRNYPVFANYANMITLIQNDENLDESQITVLKEVIEAAKPSAYKQFEGYIKYLPNLANGNSLFQSKTRKWYFEEGTSYEAKVENGKAIIVLSNATIIGRSKGDSLTIQNTNGKCFPVDKTWVGDKGKINFERAGFEANEVFAELGNYSMQLDKSDFIFDSVYLSFPKHLDGKVLGTMNDKLTSTASKSSSNPKFASFDFDLNIKNIDERITTSGGFKLIGNKIIIAGNEEKYAQLTLSKDGKKQAVAVAPSFTVRNDKQEVYTENAAVSIYMSKDSLFHPSAIFKFKMEDNILNLDRAEGIYVNVPYESAYHQMTLGLNSLKWNLDEAYIEFETIDKYSGKPVELTSYDHYVPEGELRYLTLSGRNPLRMLRDLSESYGTDYLTGEDLAGQLGFPLKQVESMIYKLAKDGFVFYNPTTKEMRVNYKVHHYMAAGKGDIDYDNLQFTSIPAGKSNGSISIDSQAILLKGIDPFYLSKPKQVLVKPKNKEMVLTENRGMALEGTLGTGNLIFKGKGINFNYDDFKVDMKSVDSLIIYVNGGEEDAEGNRALVPLNTVISDIKGTLFIDEPGNKSSAFDYPEFPYFQSFDTAYVYFDDKEDSTKFQRDKFYFQVFPFKLDSILTTSSDSIDFTGRFVSNDIFNPLVTRLTTQPDLTLGLDEMTNDKGIDVYKSNGKFYNNYKLIKEGLRGDGKLVYRKASLESTNFEFFDDSLHAALDSFYVASDASSNVPQMNIGNADAIWLPYADSLMVNGEGNFTAYNNQLDYSGNLIYSVGNLYGVSDSATLSDFHIEGASLKAADARFEQNVLTTTNGNLAIKTADGSTAAVEGNYGSSAVDFSKNNMSVSNEADSFLVNLNDNYLQTNFKNYTWDRNAQEIKFKNDAENAQYFVSTLPKLDSIKLIAGNAVLDLKESKFVANEIEGITLADSKVIPAGKSLTILQGGNFDDMENAALILNAEKAYHSLDKVDLVIRSKNDFGGTGNFKYVGNTGTPYNVVIDNIKVVTDTLKANKKGAEVAYHVEARGAISEEDKFRLDEQLLYKGNMFLTSEKQDFEFDGFGRLDLKQNPEPTWFNLAQNIDPNNFSIAIDSLIDENKLAVKTGIFVSPSELEIYSAIMEPTRSSKDNALFVSEGVLSKGEKSGEYIFGIQDSLGEEDVTLSTLKYDDNTGKVEVNGHIKWADNIALVKVDGFGKLNYDPATKAANGNSVIAIDFPMDEEIWYQFPRDLVEYNYEAEAIDYDRPEIKNALQFFVKNKNAANNIINDIEADGLFKLPLDFSHKILLTDVDLKWDPVDGNFKSTNTIGLSSIAGFPIDQQIKAYTEFGYSMGTSYMNLFFETKDGEWYYFSTKRGKMYVISSDQSFNDKVVNAKDKEIKDGKKGAVIYEFQPGNMTAKISFIQRIEEYLSRIGETNPGLQGK